MSDDQSTNWKEVLFVPLVIAIITGSSAPFWWPVYKPDPDKASAKSVGASGNFEVQTLLRKEEVKVGEEWKESNSTIWLKFEGYSHSEIEIIYNIQRTGSPISTVYYKNGKQIPVTSGGIIYYLNLGAYNQENQSISVSVYK